MLALFCCSAVAQSRVVRVGAYDNRPFQLPEMAGVTGFWPALADIAAREQWRIEYVTGSWAMACVICARTQ